MKQTLPRTIILGEIVAAHGIRGEVLIRSYAQTPTDIGAYGPLAEHGGTRTFRIAHVAPATKGVVARLDGVTDRNAAEALIGVTLSVDRDRLPQTDSSEFYHADLVGLEVVDQAGSPIGDVVAVHNHGAGDIIEVRIEGRSATELLPFTAAFVPDVDLTARRIVVILPEEDGD